MLSRGKVNILIDGQFGSTGKGVMAGYIATQYRKITNRFISIAITNASPNAGHTVDFGDGSGKKICYHLPVSALLDERTGIYLCAGSIIDPAKLLLEMETHKIAPDRIAIHPHAAIVEQRDIETEEFDRSPATKIASTRKGVGAALARKIQRYGNVAKNCPILKDMVFEWNMSHVLESDPDGVVLMEVPQGFSLGVNTGFYPYTTCREISVAQALSDLQVHPSYLGQVTMCLRTYPIRVGNIVENGKELGESGPFFKDSVETTWADIGVPEERTTVTQRIRRVATFSLEQYDQAVQILNPDNVFLNFANYMSDDELNSLLVEMDKIKVVTHLGFGPSVFDVKERI